jgi:hypothetical protein
MTARSRPVRGAGSARARLLVESPLSEPGFADGFAFFLCRQECRAEAAEDGTVMVKLTHAVQRWMALGRVEVLTPEPRLVVPVRTLDLARHAFA